MKTRTILVDLILRSAAKRSVSKDEVGPRVFARGAPVATDPGRVPRASRRPLRGVLRMRAAGLALRSRISH